MASNTGRSVIVISRDGVSTRERQTPIEIAESTGLNELDVNSILDNHSPFTMLRRNTVTALNVGYIRAFITDDSVIMVTDGIDAVNPDVFATAAAADPNLVTVAAAATALEKFISKLNRRIRTAFELINEAEADEEVRIWRESDPGKEFQYIVLDACMLAILQMLNLESSNVKSLIKSAEEATTKTQLEFSQVSNRCMRKLKLRIQMVQSAMTDMKTDMKQDNVQHLHVPALVIQLEQILDEYLPQVKNLLEDISTMAKNLEFIEEAIQQHMDREQKVLSYFLIYVAVFGAVLAGLGAAGGGVFGMDVRLPKSFIEDYTGTIFCIMEAVMMVVCRLGLLAVMIVVCRLGLLTFASFSPIRLCLG